LKIALTLSFKTLLSQKKKVSDWNAKYAGNKSMGQKNTANSSKMIDGLE